MSQNDSLYSRQSQLTLCKYDIGVVVGCGGIGNWVALDLALSGRINNLILIDPDIVEESNLNRTIYDYSDIENYKVICLAKHIETRRPQQQISIITEYMDLNLANSFIKKYMNNDNSYYHNNMCIIDCRDDVYDDCYHLRCKLYKVGYDGMNISIDGNPRLTKVFGQRGGSYTIVPSYIGSAQLAAILVCNDLLYPKLCKQLDNEYKVMLNKLTVLEKTSALASQTEDYPFLEKRIGKYDDLGHLNDVVNIDCTDLIPECCHFDEKYHKDDI